jgi:hypothetical protein
MFMTSLKCVLLVAVATSQVFGGISCCCLGSKLATSFKSDEVGLTASLEESASSTKPRVACPRCAVRKNAPAKGEQSSRSPSRYDEFSAEDRSPCQCVKLDLAASLPGEPMSFVSDNLFCECQSFIHGLTREVQTISVRDYKVPDRLGGRRWQSVACVWKN